MTKVSAPYLYRKRGVYYLQKRIPKPLIPQYGRSILQPCLNIAQPVADMLSDAVKWRTYTTVTPMTECCFRHCQDIC